MPASGDETLKVSSGNLKRGPGQVANKYKLASLPRAPGRRRAEEAPVPVRPHADLDVAGAALWQQRSETDDLTSEHVDDSKVTVNFTLGGDFAGSDLSFDRLVVPQRPGLAVVHAGDLAHEVEPITAGERFNLVFWLRERRH